MTDTTNKVVISHPDPSIQDQEFDLGDWDMLLDGIDDNAGPYFASGSQNQQAGYNKLKKTRSVGARQGTQS